MQPFYAHVEGVKVKTCRLRVSGLLGNFARSAQFVLDSTYLLSISHLGKTKPSHF